MNSQERECEILLGRWLFGVEVDRILAGIEREGGGVEVIRNAQREFNRLDSLSWQSRKESSEETQ